MKRVRSLLIMEGILLLTTLKDCFDLATINKIYYTLPEKNVVIIYNIFLNLFTGY